MDITRALLDWYGWRGRVFPFRGPKDPYLVLVSESMLQQTRTETVIAYFERFIARFPDARALALASEEEVLKAWEGLGYYSRARNLQAAAREIVKSGFPKTYEGLLALPGVGPYTAAAVGSIALSLPYPAMDGNLTRVTARLYNVKDDVTKPGVKAFLYDQAAALLADYDPGDVNQALMDLGATICLPASPRCGECPLRFFCKADDPASLPVKPPKSAPVPVKMTVLLAISDGKVLVTKREKGLLRGLNVFLLYENTPARELPFPAPALLGRARHVFTHRIWEMEIFASHLDKSDLPPDGAFFADAMALGKLPFPAAMREPKRLALTLLT